ncbi:MAG: GH25 family lysozyme [Clostridia bacterium]
MLKGTDLNSNNNISNFVALAKQIQVLINKATEGTYYKDPYLPYRVEQCKKLGLAIGVYHFAGHQVVTDEVNAFINYTKSYTFDTIAWLDIEQPPKSYSWTWQNNEPAVFVNAFLSAFKSKTGLEIGVYTNKYFYETFLKGRIPDNIKLWIADYSAITNPYPQHSWQYTESGTLLGVDTKVDLDYFQENILIKEDKKVESLVVYNYGPDMHSAEILADYLQCPTISNSRKFDYNTVKNIYAVGGNKEQYTSCLTKLIAGSDRYATNQAVLTFIKNGGK